MRKLKLLLATFFVALNGFAAEQPVYYIDSLENGSINIDERWLVSDRDSSKFRLSSYSDDHWKLQTDLREYLFGDSSTTGVKWFRVHLEVDSQLLGKAYMLNYSCLGAMEMYFNDSCIVKVGKVGTTEELTESMAKRYKLVPITFHQTKGNIIAIRYALFDKPALQQYSAIQLSVGDGINMQDEIAEYAFVFSLFIALAGIMLVLGFLHLLIYFFYKKSLENLIYFAFVISSGVMLFNEYEQIYTSELWYISKSYIVEVISLIGMFFFLHRLSYKFFSRMPKWYSYLTLSVFILSLASIYIEFIQFLIPVHLILSAIDSFRILVVAVFIKKKQHSSIVGIGMLLFLTILGFVIFSDSFNVELSFVVKLTSIYLGFMTLPISMSIYLAKKITYTAKSLEVQLVKVQELSDKTLAQEKEKKKILENQKSELERQVQERTAQLKESNEELNSSNEELKSTLDLVNEQKNEITHKNKQITDSITYAGRIQAAILGDIPYIEQQFSEAFIFFSPHSIVSGDFYWYTEIPSLSLKIIAAADCTGHGVPGAFMTVLGHDFLEEIVKKQQIWQPDKILAELDKRVIQRLQQQYNGKQVNDGMDITLLAFDTTQKKVYFAGAKNPLYYVRQGEMHQIKGSSFAIGGSQIKKQDKVFGLHEIDIQPNDVFYIFSDGYQDQFNSNGRKFLRSNFRNLLHHIAPLPVDQQKNSLRQELDKWKDTVHQTDDILVIGIKPLEH